VRTVGSAAHCDLVIADKAVSRIHFELEPRIDGLWVRDLGSRNGTFVNGVKVIEARVPAGTSIKVGTIDIAVAYASPPESVPALGDDEDDEAGPPTVALPAPSAVTPTPSPALPTKLGDLLGTSHVMRDVFARAAQLAGKSELSIIFEGEPGTGKKALARAIHDASDRAGGPFIVVECAGLPKGKKELTETLEETIASAEGGTLVLDAPHELSLAVQRELGPPLDAKAFRVLVTTQRDLRRLVNQGAFRESLYFRLAGATIKVPPLRARKGDLVPLLERFLGPDSRALATPELIADLERLPWMGNVREVKLYADRLRSGELDGAAAHLDAEGGSGARRDSGTIEAPTIGSIIANEPPAAELGRMLPIALEPWFLIGFKEFREKWIDLGEREYLRRLMQRTSRSSSAASREAGLERTYLYRLIKKHGV
jgi:two-component system, NtrC family, response regulator GlrR